MNTFKAKLPACTSCGPGLTVEGDVGIGGKGAGTSCFGTLLAGNIGSVSPLFVYRWDTAGFKEKHCIAALR